MGSEQCPAFPFKLLLDAIHRFLAVFKGHVLPSQVPHFQIYGILEELHMAGGTQHWQGLIASLWPPVASPALPFPGPVVRWQPWDLAPHTGGQVRASPRRSLPVLAES